MLVGSDSWDADEDEIFYAWIVTSPDDTETTFTDVNPTFVIDQSGDYYVQLTVYDYLDSSVTKELTVTTANTPPVADAGLDDTVTVGQTVELSGSGSSDVDGDQLNYRWSFVNSPSGTSTTLSDSTTVMPSFEIDRPGTYTLQLIVNDGTVDSNPDTVNITTINSPPVADAGLDDSVVIGQKVILDGRSSYDPDGDAFDYSWSITDKPKDSVAALSNPGAEITDFIVDAAGTYVAQLIVNDGTIDSKADTVIITTENSAPMADAGPDTYIIAGETATLDGSASSDADADPLTCTWSFTSKPDESTAAIAAPHEIGTSFDADAAGIYVVQLIVNDGTVNSPAVTVTITVEPPPVKEPICGDSVLDPNEQCDDGNNTNDDGCTATCSIEPKPIVEPDPIVEPEPIVEPKPIVEPDPIVKPDPIVEPKPIVEPDPIVKPEPIVEPKPIVEPDPIVKPEPIVEPKPIVEPDPIVKPEPIVEPKPIVRGDDEEDDDADDDRKDEIDDDDERDDDGRKYRSKHRRTYRSFFRYLWSKYFFYRR